MTEDTRSATQIPENITPTAEKDSKLERNPFADNGKKKKSRFSKKQKKVFFISLIVLFIALAILSVKLILDKNKNQNGETQTAVVTRGRLESSITGWGTVVPKQQETLGEDIRGEITRIYVKAGDSVKTGDPIFSVDDEVMRDDLDTAKTELYSAEESLDTINEGIINLTLKAPFKGKLISLETTGIKPGQDISSGTTVGTYVDDSVMKLSLFYSYGFLDQVRAGMDATVTIPASMSTISGKVESVENVKKITEEGSVLFKVNLSIANPGTLTKDMAASAVIKTANGEIMPAGAGKLEYSREETLSFKASGEVVSANIHEFKEYDAGQVMCSLKADRDPEKQLADAQRKLSDAQKKVEECEKALAKSTLTSPIEGIVTSILKEVGDEIENLGTDVVVISDLSKMIVEINVDEIDISKVSIGVPAEISYDKTDGTAALMGEVSSVSFEAKSDSSQSGGVAYFPAKIIIDNPGDLMPGVGVNYRISSMVKEDCLMVPSAAVTFTEGGTAVFVKPADGREIENPASVPPEQVPKGFQAALVEIGLADDQNTEIVSGLSEGDEVALIGQPTDPNMMGGGGVAVRVG